MKAAQHNNKRNAAPSHSKSHNQNHKGGKQQNSNQRQTSSDDHEFTLHGLHHRSLVDNELAEMLREKSRVLQRASKSTLAGKTRFRLLFQENRYLTDASLGHAAQFIQQLPFFLDLKKELAAAAEQVHRRGIDAIIAFSKAQKKNKQKILISEFNMSGNQLDGSGLQHLVSDDSLRLFLQVSLLNIRLSWNEIDRGMSYLAELLRGNVSLETLDLNKNRIGDRPGSLRELIEQAWIRTADWKQLPMNQASDASASADVQDIEIDEERHGLRRSSAVEGLSLSGRSVAAKQQQQPSVERLGRVVFHHAAPLPPPSALTTLLLVGNGIRDDQDVRAIGDLLVSNSAISELNIADNELGRSSAISEIFLALKFNTNLKVLNLSNNDISMRPLQDLALSNVQNATLRELNLSDNPRLGIDGMRTALQREMARDNLMYDQYEVNDGIFGLCAVISEKKLSGLRRLLLGGRCSISQYDLSLLAKHLKHNESLQFLDISGTTVSQKSIGHFEDMLDSNKTLCALQLSADDMERLDTKVMRQLLLDNINLAAKRKLGEASTDAVPIHQADCSLLDLPAEILHHICEYIKPRSLCSLEATCHTMRHVMTFSEEMSVWKRRLEHSFVMNLYDNVQPSVSVDSNKFICWKQKFLYLYKHLAHGMTINARVMVTASVASLFEIEGQALTTIDVITVSMQIPRPLYSEVHWQSVKDLRFAFRFKGWSPVQSISSNTIPPSARGCIVCFSPSFGFLCEFDISDVVDLDCILGWPDDWSLVSSCGTKLVHGHREPSHAGKLGYLYIQQVSTGGNLSSYLDLKKSFGKDAFEAAEMFENQSRVIEDGGQQHMDSEHEQKPVVLVSRFRVSYPLWREQWQKLISKYRLWKARSGPLNMFHDSSRNTPQSFTQSGHHQESSSRRRRTNACAVTKPVNQGTLPNSTSSSE